MLTFLDLSRFFERLEQTTKRLEMFSILAELFAGAGRDEIAPLIYLTQGELLPSFRGLQIGMSEKLLIRAIAQAAESEPAEVAAAFKRTGDLGKTAEALLGGTGRRLGVKAVYDELVRTARISGEGSVEEKVGALADLLRRVSPPEARYIARVVMGRLRLGAGDATILEALSVAVLKDRSGKPVLERAYNLCSDLGVVGEELLAGGVAGVEAIHARLGYPIRPALCERLPTTEEIIDKIGRCGVELKYDGLRLQIHREGDTVEMFSRNLERMSPMFPEISEAVRRAVQSRSVILEGEALAVDESSGELQPFQVTVQRKRKHDIAAVAKEIPLRFFAFDLLFLDGEDYTPRPYAERRRALRALLKPDPVIELSRAIETDNPAELQRFFDEAVANGQEGIVAKRLDGPYTAGARNFNWIKLKRSYRGELTDTVDVVIVGYSAGRGQRAKFGVGTVLAAVYDDRSDTFKTVTKIGTGFSEEELRELKSKLDEIALDHKPARVDSLIEPDVWVEPRYVLTVMADEITRSPMHTCGKEGDDPGYAMRFPRTVGFIRTDKRAEDATTVAEVVELFEQQKRVKVE
ncbi:MAG TPA: ATP-dependent DNA ligase [Nitrospiria bacterium]|nr:ATP-dependent DNA ligase [Nitrospiria bacterium]